jgi:hypothetical protein
MTFHQLTIRQRDSSPTGSGSKLKQNFQRQFFSQILISKKSNQIKNTGVIHQSFFQKVVSAILYLFSGKIFVKNN